MTKWMATAAGLAGFGLLAAACSSGSSTTATGSATPGSPAAARAATVSLRALSGIPGKALIGSNGRTLYLFEADKNGTSACSGACASAWPPDIVAGSPQAGDGVSQSLLGTVKRADGTMQLTYNGHPLYYFTADTAGGAAHGQGVKAFGAGWYVVSASGKKIDTN